LGPAQWRIVRRRIEHVGRWPVATTVRSVLAAPFLIAIALAFQPPELHYEASPLNYRGCNALITDEGRHMVLRL